MVSRRIGLTAASFAGLGLDAVLDAARTARVRGYDSFWTAETVGAEAFATLAAVAGAAPGIGLGTGVLAMPLRTPPLTAMGAATLAALAPDAEIQLGVGVSSPVVVNRWHGAAYGDRPLARTREYLELLRACLSGEAVHHNGEFHTVKGFRLGVRLGDQRPRIVLGALNEGMLRLAGELADGVLLNYLPASAVPWCVEQVRAGEAAGNRPVGSCRVSAYVHVGVCDPETARPAARRDIFSYAVVDAYGRAFARAGFAAEVDAIVDAHRRGDREAAVAAVSDRMCDAIDVCGSAEHIAATVAAYRAAGVEEPVIMPLPWGPDRRATLEATIAACADS